MERQRINAQHINIGAIIVAGERRWVMSKKLAVVVTGGTGKQGGAVVKSLLERGHEVRAVTRSTDSAKARELANAGVTLVRASLEDSAALTKALEGATSLFAMTTPFEGGTQAETRQGISAANAAKAAGVHLVFTSVAPPIDRRAFRTSRASTRSKSTSPRSAYVPRSWRPSTSWRTSFSA